VHPELVFSRFRVEKQRVKSMLALSSGHSPEGCFFVAGGSPRHGGPERVGDLLNAADGLFPFEIDDGDDRRTVLFHRRHLVTVTLAENEAVREPGYNVATRRAVSLLLSNGRRLTGIVLIYRPEGHDRLSDWAQHGERFRYVETSRAPVIVNIDHIVEAREVIE
jgi:hypothetical protein